MQDYLSVVIEATIQKSVTEHGRHLGVLRCALIGITGYSHTQPQRHRASTTSTYTLFRPSNLGFLSIHHQATQITRTHHTLHKQLVHIQPITMSTTGKLGTGMASDTKTPANAGIGEDKPGAFDAKGAVGHAFTENGAIGGTANAIGGPLAKDGVIGKQFTTEGSVGGTVQNTLGGTSSKSN
ncbi:hypothetical protein DL546_007519 [Coniochaeta pulveracea]|uniref:Uncharacterized protein n=1 Tax=Coniochaeta pulveracea TaxID=177199 RepID=A0A420YLU7_9PEZI|nr:hypothetical protein DL546_007519 [Coniochaeta pulveracea]